MEMIKNGRIRSGDKTPQQKRHFNRSTFNKNKVWRSSMSAGTVVPCLNELATNGQENEIDIHIDVKTLPTNGPLFGTFDIQVDIFTSAIRLYNAKMMINHIDIGRDVSKLHLPQYQLDHYYKASDLEYDNSQISSSSIFHYTGIKGLGRKDTGEGLIERNFNALGILVYWDIIKNYYANKQEEQAYVIHNSFEKDYLDLYNIVWRVKRLATGGGGVERTVVRHVATSAGDEVRVTEDTTLWLRWKKNTIGQPNKDVPFITQESEETGNAETYTLNELFNKFELNEEEEYYELICSEPKVVSTALEEWYREIQIESDLDVSQIPKLVSFDLSEIDDMRKLIMLAVGDSVPFEIRRGTTTPTPYRLPLQYYPNDDNGTPVGINADSRFSKQGSQEGLAVKTYHSDLFNNWSNKEWIEGADGVNEVSAVAIIDGKLNLDSLNVAKKVYRMLNRISMSGGSLDDYYDAVYDHKRVKQSQSPVYHGGLMKEITFQEVVSTADVQNSGLEQPLGTLAGRGVMGSKHVGGKVVVKVDEPSYIMGCVSITPRIDYSQGNHWQNLLLTLDDFHKPDLDGIGFQDLITDQMHWADTIVNDQGDVTYHSAGKQVSWQNWMTEVNETHGSFAEVNDAMFMTNNRRYEVDTNGIIDLTTYIDPTKFNHIFAQTSLDSQNFWVQIAFKNTKRAKMSSKQIPNI